MPAPTAVGSCLGGWDGSLRLVFSAGSVGFEDAPDFVPYSAENGELLFLGSGRVRRVVKAPVMPVELPGKQRARLIGVAADRDHRLHVLVEKFVEVLGTMVRDIKADLFHYLDRHGVDVTRGFRAGAGDSQGIACRGAQDPFGQVRSAGVAGAENEDEQFFHGYG